MGRYWAGPFIGTDYDVRAATRSGPGAMIDGVIDKIFGLLTALKNLVFAHLTLVIQLDNASASRPKIFG